MPRNLPLNLPVGELPGLLTELLPRAEYGPIKGALASVALAGGRLVAGFVAFASEERAPKCLRRYQNVTLAEEWIAENGAAISRLGEILAARGRVAGESVESSFQHANVSQRVGPQGTLSGFSEIQFDCPAQPAVDASSNDPTLGFGLRPYFSVAHAVSEQIYGLDRPWSLGGQAPYGGRLMVVVPDTRASLMARWSPAKATLETQVTGWAAWGDVELQILANATTPLQENLAASPDGQAVISIPSDTRNILVALVHRDGSQLARLYLTPESPSFGLEEAEPIGAAARAAEDLAAGESDEVEFKPFVKKKDPKEAEFVETVIAFANTAGGRIYVGVDRHGAPQGVKGLRQAGYSGAEGGPAPQSLEDAAKRLRELIQEHVKPVPHYQVEIAETAGTKIIVATIGRGDQQPYSRQITNDVYIRKGATNRRPDPQAEMPASAPSYFGGP